MSKDAPVLRTDPRADDDALPTALCAASTCCQSCAYQAPLTGSA